MKEKMTYNLYSTERIYKNDTLISFYFQPNKKIIKKCSPIDIDGERFKLNKETGEIQNYKLKDVLASKNSSLRRTTILMNMLLAMNDFDWFWTLTFDKDKIDRTNDGEVFKCYKKYIHNLIRKYPNFKYLTVPERHENGCIHFHILTAGITAQQMGLVNSGKVCCHWATKKNGVASKEYYNKTKYLHELKETDGEPIFNITSFAYGYTTVSRICSRERCNSYVKKYIQKSLGSTEIFKKRFYYSSNLNVPEIVKRLVGANFETPHDIDTVSDIKNNPFVKCATGLYKSDYNVLQIKINNQTKRLIDNGFEILNNEEQTPFDNKENYDK